MSCRTILILLIAVGLSACGRPEDDPATVPAFQPELATLPPLPALMASESGRQRLATVTASERLDHDPRAHALEIELLELIGRARSQDHLPALTPDETLQVIAELLARDMLVRDYVGHEDPETGAVLADEWVADAGYVGDVSLLIFTSTADPQLLAQETYLRWMSSSSHRALLLSPTFRQVGIGIARNGDWRVIVALLAQERR